MDRPRAADDFATIRARMEELRREQDGADPMDKEPLAPAVRRLLRSGPDSSQVAAAGAPAKKTRDWQARRGDVDHRL